MSRADAVDRFQRRHSWVGFPLAVLYKLVDDRGLYLAALVTYYGFVSLFPLLLLFTSILGFLLDQDPGLRRQVLDGVLQSFPGLGGRLRSNIEGFHGSVGGIAVGVVGTLYGALGAAQAAQAAFNQIYGVPRSSQPNPIRSRIRSLGLLVLLGAAVLVATGISALVSTGNGLSAQLDLGIRIAGYVLAFAVNMALFSLAFKLLTAQEAQGSRVISGGIIAGAAWELVQIFGSRYVAHEAAHAGSLYGIFGVVLAAIAWIYLEALALIVSAETNVVIHYRLWPRALLTPFTDQVDLTDADRRAYTMYARAQRFKGFEDIEVRFLDRPRDGSDDGKRSPPSGGDPDATPGTAARRDGPVRPAPEQVERRDR